MRAIYRHFSVFHQPGTITLVTSFELLRSRTFEKEYLGMHTAFILLVLIALPGFTYCCCHLYSYGVLYERWKARSRLPLIQY